MHEKTQVSIFEYMTKRTQVSILENMTKVAVVVVSRIILLEGMSKPNKSMLHSFQGLNEGVFMFMIFELFPP